MTTGQADGLLSDVGLLSQLVNTIVDGIVVQDATGDVVWFNEAALDMLGLTAEEMHGASSSDGLTVLRDDGSPYRQSEHPSTVSLRTGISQPQEVVGVRAPSGEVRWMRVNCTVIELADGRGVASILSDVTAARNVQVELRNTLQTLQRSLLPRRAPRIHDLDVAVRYQSAGPTLMVGGDFYGTLPVDERRHAFFIGDVCGRGVEAASLTSLARHTLEAAGRHVDRTDEALRWLHEAIAAEERHTFCTAIFGFVERDGERALVEMTLGGHPQPILLRRDGAKTLVGTPGQLLGILDEWSATVSRLALEPGDQLVLYTDGLIDTPRPRLSDECLLGRIERRESAEETADQVLSVATPSGGCPQDDTAVMIIGIAAAGDSQERGRSS